MMRRGWLLAAQVTMLLCSPPTAQAQAQAESQATFRATTRLIVQNVRATDDDGAVVEGLTPADFIVVEDGERQDVAFVEFQHLREGPSPAGSGATVAVAAAGIELPTLTDIAAPPAGDIQYQDRRLLVFYFDRSMAAPADQLRAFAHAVRYIDMYMATADLIAIMAFQDGAVQVRSDFTDDRAHLREVIGILAAGDDLDGDGSGDVTVGTAFGQNDGEFALFTTDRQLAALQTAVSMLRPLPERKTLIYFSGGLQLQGSDNLAQLRATINAAIRANVTLNPVDARGLVATPPLGDATVQASGIGTFTGALAASITSRFQRSQDTLYALAADTGGKAFFDYNDLSVGIAQAAEAVGDYYILGYYSTHPEEDGRFRRVEIAVADRPDARVAYRGGYYADKSFARSSEADRERQLEEALMLENPITEITLAVETNYFQLNRAEYFVPVAVKLPGRELALARSRGVAGTVLDIIGEVKDEHGYTLQNMRDRLDVRLDTETASQLATRPLLYETGFTLLPGKHVLKVLVRDSTTGRIGTYETPFEIPNLMSEELRLPISSVVLGSQRIPFEQALLTVQEGAEQSTNPLVFDGEKLFPSVTRAFRRDQKLFVYLQAYERGAEAIRPLVAYVSVFRSEDQVLETRPLIIDQGLHGRASAVPLRLVVPLEGLSPAQYVCQVTVLDPEGGKVAFWRGPIAILP